MKKNEYLSRIFRTKYKKHITAMTERKTADKTPQIITVLITNAQESNTVTTLERSILHVRSGTLARVARGEACSTWLPNLCAAVRFSMNVEYWSYVKNVRTRPSLARLAMTRILRTFDALLASCVPPPVLALLREHRGEQGSGEGAASAPARRAAPLTRVEEQVYAAVTRNPRVRYREIAAALHVSRTTVYKAVRRLKAIGYLRRAGARKNGLWEPLRPAAPALSPSRGATNKPHGDIEIREKSAADAPPPLAARTLAALRRDHSATYAALARALGVSQGSVYNAVRQLKRLGYIRRTGGRKRGAWEILR